MNRHLVDALTAAYRRDRELFHRAVGSLTADDWDCAHDDLRAVVRLLAGRRWPDGLDLNDVAAFARDAAAANSGWANVPALAVEAAVRDAAGEPGVGSIFPPAVLATFMIVAAAELSRSVGVEPASAAELAARNT